MGNSMLDRELGGLMRLWLIFTTIMVIFYHNAYATDIEVNHDTDSGTNEWTPSSGTDHSALVDDGSSHDSDSTYLSTSASGNEERFETTDASIPGTATIDSVESCTVAKRVSGQRQLRNLLHHDATYTGSTYTLAGGDTAYSERCDDFTAQESWQPADFNGDASSADVAFDSGTSKGGNGRVTASYIKVTYTDSGGSRKVAIVS